MATSSIPAPRLEALRKEVFDCSRCGFCRVWDWKGVDWVCPTYPYTEAYDTQYARGRVNMAQAILKGEAEVDETFLEHLAQCSLCGSCGVHCPVGMPLLEIWSALRADLVDAGLMTENQRTVRDNTAATSQHLWAGRRVRWRTPGAAQGGRAVFPRLPNHTQDQADRQVDDGVAGQAGGELRRAGRGRLLWLPAVRHRADGRHAAGGRIHAGQDPGLSTGHRPDDLRRLLPGVHSSLSGDLGIETGLNFQHTHEFFPSLAAGKLHTIDRKVTYHDPCVMGRHMGIYDPPRELIRSVPGVELVEMYSNREHALCCGAGGGVLSAFTDLAGDVAVERLQQAAAAGATQVVSSCPTCVVNLKRSVAKAGLNLTVTDIVDLLNEAL